ncbi:hypothetical protein E5163_08515 [Marinicauda algicola]|uniref:Uncharacterized protein n=2 Tax=Marinicauda algicola TaxID=2029849 RepID=A0A4S2H0T5_9PROT|nr:hypothetical protein [Marinicauda algicola]TGY89157.1 hypothetical protein E5163_08515 [Marinicauda algicola]
MRPETEAETLRDRLSRMERQLAHVEQLLAALARHAGIDAGDCPACGYGRLQYTVDKTHRTFGVVSTACDSSEQEPAAESPTRVSPA